MQSFDVIGQHRYWPVWITGRDGWECQCQWGYTVHGIVCPEHGIEGLVLIREFLALPGIPVMEHQASSIVPEVTERRITSEENS